ncbi:hypothetical protein EM308_13390 [Flavobacterium gilvum]|uniref:Uncharacterized protein n=1 Tax=Flavobacterium gilvum TaxID=1492737 RepID=A0AAC9I4T3_9FLAO|nr:hypothetical protein EM308_13390 [Flavobacterium gilvum]
MSNRYGHGLKIRAIRYQKSFGWKGYKCLKYNSTHYSDLKTNKKSIRTNGFFCYINLFCHSDGAGISNRSSTKIGDFDCGVTYCDSSFLEMTILCKKSAEYCSLICIY